MSLSLDLGTKPAGVVASCSMDSQTVHLSGQMEHTRLPIKIDLSMADFCELAKYVLTITDIVENDPRLHLMNEIAKLNPIAGYNPGGFRLGVSR